MCFVLRYIYIFPKTKMNLVVLSAAVLSVLLMKTCNMKKNATGNTADTPKNFKVSKSLFLLISLF